MGEVKVRLSDETEGAFRKSAMETFGYGRGSLSSAAEEAVKEWVAARPKAAEKAESLGKLIGVLKHVKKSSVELQHEIGDIRRARYHAHRR
ncbi:hypothetical protein HYU17_02630 [Candidatus Woesearchaeota archaeon]|nr:hypothetical protein [Candidatus Woesearchaeota archaeon]